MKYLKTYENYKMKSSDLDRSDVEFYIKELQDVLESDLKYNLETFTSSRLSGDNRFIQKYKVYGDEYVYVLIQDHEWSYSNYYFNIMTKDTYQHFEEFKISDEIYEDIRKILTEFYDWQTKSCETYDFQKKSIELNRKEYLNYKDDGIIHPDIEKEFKYLEEGENLGLI